MTWKVFIPYNIPNRKSDGIRALYRIMSTFRKCQNERKNHNENVTKPVPKRVSRKKIKNEFQENSDSMSQNEFQEKFLRRSHNGRLKGVRVSTGSPGT